VKITPSIFLQEPYIFPWSIWWWPVSEIRC